MPQFFYITLTRFSNGKWVNMTLPNLYDETYIKENLENDYMVVIGTWQMLLEGGYDLCTQDFFEYVEDIDGVVYGDLSRANLDKWNA